MAVAAQAKAPSSDIIMSPDRMKPMLALSKREPVQAAFGLAADGEAVILLDKKMKPKTVLAKLKADAAKAKIPLQPSSLRFGKAEVDTDYDSSMVRFFINKDAPGNMRAKLVTVVKRIPYQKVEINVDPSLEEEPEDDGTTTEPDASAAPAEAAPPVAPALDAAVLMKDLGLLARQISEVPGVDAASKAALVKMATEANAAMKSGALDTAAGLIAQLAQALNVPAAPAPPAAAESAAPRSASTPDVAALSGELGTLARRIAAATATDPALRGALAKLATDAQGALKTNDAAAAAGLLAQLRERLDGASAAPPAVQIWNDAKESADQQLNQLYATLRKTGLPVLDEVAGEIEAVLGAFRTGMITALMNYDQAAGAKKDDARVNALRTVEEHRARIPADPHVIAADTNPFGVPVSIRATLGEALDKLTGRLAATG